jgi:uncharacterized protein (TIGR04255 family)
MAVKYSQAPISEVVCGVFFKSNLLLNGSILFQLLSQLSSEFAVLLTHPTLPEEEVINDSIHATTDYQRAGFTMYRLLTEDKHWQVLVQQNMISFHWARQDEEAVGNYPGFADVYEGFRKLFNRVRDLVKDDTKLFSDIKACYLSYVDRVNLEIYKQQNLRISDILSITPPGFCVNEKQFLANNYFARFSAPCDEINGFSIMSMNSPTIISIGQVLVVDNKLKGVPKEQGNIDGWFSTAHEIQLSFFENIFKPGILEIWK